eukprot:gene119-176_t
MTKHGIGAVVTEKKMKKAHGQSQSSSVKTGRMRTGKEKPGGVLSPGNDLVMDIEYEQFAEETQDVVPEELKADEKKRRYADEESSGDDYKMSFDGERVLDERDSDEEDEDEDEVDMKTSEKKSNLIKQRFSQDEINEWKRIHEQNQNEQIELRNQIEKLQKETEMLRGREHNDNTAIAVTIANTVINPLSGQCLRYTEIQRLKNEINLQEMNSTTPTNRYSFIPLNLQHLITMKYRVFHKNFPDVYKTADHKNENNEDFFNTILKMVQDSEGPDGQLDIIEKVAKIRLAYQGDSTAGDIYTMKITDEIAHEGYTFATIPAHIEKKLLQTVSDNIYVAGEEYKMSSTERKYVKCSQKIKKLLKEKDLQTIEKYLEEVQIQVMNVRTQLLLAESVGMKLDTSEEVIMRNKDQYNIIKDTARHQNGYPNNSRWGGGPLKRAEDYGEQNVEVGQHKVQWEEQPWNNTKGKPQQWREPAARVQQRDIVQPRKSEAQKSQVVEHRCRGCGYPHAGGRELCKMKYHPDYNREDRPFENSTVGQIYYKFRMYALDRYKVYNRVTDRMENYREVCQCMICLINDVNKNFLTATILDQKVIVAAKKRERSKGTAAVNNQTYQVLLDTGALNDNYVNDIVAANMMTLYELVVVIEKDFANNKKRKFDRDTDNKSDMLSGTDKRRIPNLDMEGHPWTNTKYTHCEMETSIPRKNDALYVFATTCHKVKIMLKKDEVIDAEVDDDQVNEYYERFDWYDEIYNNKNIAATVDRSLTPTETIGKKHSPMPCFADTVERRETPKGSIDKTNSSMLGLADGVERRETPTQIIEKRESSMSQIVERIATPTTYNNQRAEEVTDRDKQILVDQSIENEMDQEHYNNQKDNDIDQSKNKNNKDKELDQKGKTGEKEQSENQLIKEEVRSSVDKTKKKDDKMVDQCLNKKPEFLINVIKKVEFEEKNIRRARILWVEEIAAVVKKFV